LNDLGLAKAETVPVLVHNFLGMAALLSADLPAADRDLRAAVSVELVPPPLSQLNAAAYLSLVQCERGELGPAQRAALDVIRTAAEAALERTPQVVGAYLTMAHVALDLAHPDDADEWLGRAAAVEEVAGEPHVRVETALLLAARREAVGNRERALSGLRATASEIDLAPLPRTVQERWWLAEAALLVGLGDPLQARAILERSAPVSVTASVLAAARLLVLLDDLPAAVAARARVDPEEHPRGRVDVSLLDTALALASGDEEAAQDRIEDALAAAAPWFLRRPFLTEVIDLRPLLERRLERGTVVPAFAVDVLGRLSRAPAADPDAWAPVDPLTERERTVLRYLASTLSNAEIAADLYVSVNTVKTHARHVYRKLGVTGRRQLTRTAS
jgi:LuxR family transcriptional regulator, maltose regulon positive regulatory protein